MSPGKRLLLLILIMILVTFIAEGISIAILYNTAFNEEKARLRETAGSQARLIEAIAAFDSLYSKDYPEGSRQATLSQIINAHRKYKGFGLSGEFTLAEKKGENIVFILSHQQLNMQAIEPVPFDSDLAEPMRRALSGESGTTIGPDYRGVPVLAAYEYVSGIDLGIVSKIDLSEIRAPFIRAAVISGIAGLISILAGSYLFLKITNPLIRKLSDTVKDLKDALAKVRQLTGLLPICASCKKIRNDKGQWEQLEVYIRDHSEADFSHGLCPDCLAKCRSDAATSNNRETKTGEQPPEKSI
ncbi:MAG TPA: hypothetical protein PK358_00620 [Spirochaetota bacterium]|nr:hypothetical protein [Spirochaetota bacterium]HPJ33305.1 hypothetical protein [Spirochaetota bacterium]